MNQQLFMNCYSNLLCLLNSTAYVVQCTNYFSGRAIQKTIQHLNQYFKGLILIYSACHHFQIIINSTLMHIDCHSICISHSEDSFFLDFLLLILNHPLLNFPEIYCPSIKKLKKINLFITCYLLKTSLKTLTFG